MIKTVNTQGVSFIEPLSGSGEWYWGTDNMNRDLSEVGELYRANIFVPCNLLMFIRYPKGHPVELVKGEAGQYFGTPILCEDTIQILMADFNKESICIFQCDHGANYIFNVINIPLPLAENSYNVKLHSDPLMLTRQTDRKFEILWPEKVEFEIGPTETFGKRKGDMMFFSRWCAEPKYREEVVIRKYPTGEIYKVAPGAWREMPDGQIWILQDRLDFLQAILK